MREVQPDSSGTPSLDQESIQRPAEFAHRGEQLEDLVRSYAKKLLSHARKQEWNLASDLIDTIDHDLQISMPDFRRIVSAIHSRGNLSPLHFAAMYKAPIEFVERLLSVYPALDRVGHVKRRSDGATVRSATALHMALESGHLGIAERLLEAGASVEKINGLGETPLLTLIKASDRIEGFEDLAPAIVRTLLEREVPLGVKDTQGRSGLLHSTERGLWDLATILSEAHLERANATGTAISTRQELHKCIFAALNHTDKAASLVENLSQLYMKAPEGSEEAIVSTDHDRLLTELVPDNYQRFHWMRIQSVLEQSLRTPHLFSDSFVSDLLQKRNSLGQQVVHILIESGAPSKVVELALDRGADAEATCYVDLPFAGPVGGFTPLHLSVARDQFDTAQLLLSRGVKVDPTSELGETPFSMYIQGRPATLSMGMISLLLKQGAEVTELSRNALIATLYEAANKDFTALKSFIQLADVLLPELTDQQYWVMSGGESKSVGYFDFVDSLLTLAASTAVGRTRMSALLWKQLGEQISRLELPEKILPEPEKEGPLTDDDILKILLDPLAGVDSFMFETFAFGDPGGDDYGYDINFYGHHGTRIVSQMLAEGGSLQDVYNYLRSFEALNDYVNHNSGHASRIEPYSEPADYPLTKLLQPLLFRYSPGMLSGFAQFVEAKSERISELNDWHPYIAEMMALLNHPRDDRKDNHTIGALTSSLSSITRFVNFGVRVTGRMAYDWGRIGTLAFSFPRWRFDCEGHQEVSNDGKKSFSQSLLEQAGFTRVDNRSSDVRVNEETGKEEQFLGRGFVALPGTKLAGGYWKPRHDGTRELIPIGKDTFVELRRAYLLVSDPNGTLLIRNSSTVFGRDTFRYPAYYSEKGFGRGLSAKQLLQLEPDNLKAFGFKHILDPGLYGKDRHRSYGASITHLLDQLSAVLEAYGSWKCNTQFDSAWDREKTGEDALIGGYRSPGFTALVSFLERRQEEVSMDMLIHGKSWKLLPDLGICRSEFVPWVPDARLKVTPEVIRGLRHLADNGMSQFGAFADTGIRDFFNLAMQQQGELVLLAPEKRRN